jgi:protein-histidine N-methyltransferase
MLEKRKPKHLSPWTPFLDTLPEKWDQFPIFFSEEELSYLKESPFLAHIEQNKKGILDIYHKLCVEIPEYKQFSLRQF